MSTEKLTNMYYKDGKRRHFPHLHPRNVDKRFELLKIAAQIGSPAGGDAGLYDIMSFAERLYWYVHERKLPEGVTDVLTDSNDNGTGSGSDS